MRRIGEWILAVYLGLAPVYWLPGISMGRLAALKFLLIGTGVIAIWLNALVKDQLRFPTGILGPPGLILVLLAASSGFLQARPEGLLSNFKDLVLGFVVLWTFYLLKRTGGDEVRIFKVAGLIIFVCCLPVLTNWFMGLPDWYSPPSGDRIFPLSISRTGFGDKRTGWSNAIALYLPILVAYLMFKVKRGRRFWAVTLVVFVIIGCQLITGGRGGMIGALAGLVLMAMLMFPTRWSALIILVVAVGAYFLFDFLLEHLRLQQLATTGAGSYESVNELSTNRLRGYMLGLEYFFKRPFTGYGFDVGKEILLNRHSYEIEIHNTWLRLMVDAGIFLPLVCFALIGKMLRRGWRRLDVSRVKEGLRSGRTHLFRTVSFPVALGVVLVVGVVISMFVPNAIIGSFQNEAVWWAVGGAVVAPLSDEHGRKRQPEGSAHQHAAGAPAC